MDWMINELEIENFKSIKNEKINCKRLNVFIGKPNVGKSNILEAVSMLGDYNSQNKRFFSEYVRYEKVRNIFYDNDRNRPVIIKSNLGYFICKFQNVNEYHILYGFDRENSKNFLSAENLNDLKIDMSPPLPLFVIPTLTFKINDDGEVREIISGNNFQGNIRKYEFKKNIELTGKFSSFLKPPYGENIFLLLESNPKLFDEASEIFDQYGLQLLFDNDTNKLEIQKTVGKRVYKIPYSLCADTLQRYIFHLLAIKTNSKSIIILEEPEAHSFPKYISEIAGEIIADKNNQYFIATHSPYILTDFIEKCDVEDLALFICDYKDYKTIIRELTREEISNIIDTGIDLFYNMNAFQ